MSVATAVVLALALAGSSPAISPDVPVPADADVPPRALELTKPNYPRKAFDRRIEGVVLLEILIDERGRVARARVLESVPELNEAAVKAVKKWRFAPATKDGRPVATIAHAPVTFCIFDGCQPARAGTTPE